jgi:FMN reductase (NADPH)
MSLKISPELKAQLEAKNIYANSLTELIEVAYALGFRSIQFHHKGYVWLEKEPEAYRGDGNPDEALTLAILQAPKERFIP